MNFNFDELDTEEIIEILLKNKIDEKTLDEYSECFTEDSWFAISIRQKISNDFIKKYLDKIDLNNIFMYNPYVKLDKELIEKNIKSFERFGVLVKIPFEESAPLLYPNSKDPLRALIIDNFSDIVNNKSIYRKLIECKNCYNIILSMVQIVPFKKRFIKDMYLDNYIYNKYSELLNKYPESLLLNKHLPEKERTIIKLKIL
ncbi:hypothetical protein Bp8pS_239 [Bacillus phage vB_BpuM-BpSp]|nr:hypothetical protein Bp8pS_239 [Bacillus phage vB_BpuM-BpSp]